MEQKHSNSLYFLLMIIISLSQIVKGIDFFKSNTTILKEASNALEEYTKSRLSDALMLSKAEDIQLFFEKKGTFRIVKKLYRQVTSITKTLNVRFNNVFSPCNWSIEATDILKACNELQQQLYIIYIAAVFIPILKQLNDGPVLVKPLISHAENLLKENIDLAEEMLKRENPIDYLYNHGWLYDPSRLKRFLEYALHLMEEKKNNNQLYGFIFQNIFRLYSVIDASVFCPVVDLSKSVGTYKRF